MSILTTINDNVQLGRLVHFIPSEPVGILPIRKMYLKTELYEEITKDRDSEEEMDRFVKLEVDLGAFVIDETLYPDYLKLLEPTQVGIWAIRSVEPDPHIRVFGVFADFNIFVCTHYEYRPNLDYPEMWDAETKRTKCKWEDLFPGFNFKTTNDVHRLFSGALDNETYTQK